MSNETSLRTAVIGLGRMGMHHVRACQDVSGADLVAVLDHKPDWAVQVGADTQCLVAADVESLFGKIDIAIVAVPTADHPATAVPLLQQGISCLVEKPITLTEADAERMIATAERCGSMLQVGHVERFNPAVAYMISQLNESDPIGRMTFRRHNTASDRNYDVDAVLDLMTHDLDLLTLLPLGEIGDVSVEDGADRHATSAQLTCGGQTIVTLSVDRWATQQVRDWVIETSAAVYTVDFVAQHVILESNGKTKQVPVEQGDALRAQLSAFVHGVQSGECRGATGQDALTVLRIANRIRSTAGLI